VHDLPASRSVSRVLAAAFVLASGAGASAHRYDELLQATRIGMESDRVRLEMSLTPGIAVAPAAIRAIDIDGDGVFSSVERRAYATAVLKNLSVRVDEGPALQLALADSNFPAPSTMLNSDVPIGITLEAELPRLDSGDHHLRFRNDNATAGSVYLANALVPDTTRIAITGQDRDADQRELTIAFTVSEAGPSLAELGWIAAAGMLLLLPLHRRVRMVTLGAR
jgi:nickel/cobalt exporter